MTSLVAVINENPRLHFSQWSSFVSEVAASFDRNAIGPRSKGYSVSSDCAQYAVWVAERVTLVGIAAILEDLAMTSARHERAGVMVSVQGDGFSDTAFISACDR